MSRTIFMDVGANNGQTLSAIIDPAFGFERIICFEPVKSCVEKLRALAGADKRVLIEPFGLWNKACDQDVFHPGSKGAGIWKKDAGRSDATERCPFVRASDWMRGHISATDVAYLKLNCEGAECDILDDLLDSGEFEKIDFAMIDFDVRKIASQRHREAEIRARVEGFGFPRIAFSKQVMRGDTHAARIRNWLSLVDNA